MTISTFRFAFRLLRHSRLTIPAALAILPSIAQAQYTWVPTGNQQGQWTASARWTGGPAGTFPNAADATATFNLPLSTAPSGNYNVQVSNTAGSAVTVGTVTINNSVGATGGLRFGANGNGTITFQSTNGPAQLIDNPAAPDDSAFNTTFFAPVIFASDTVITNNHNVAANASLQFDTSNNSPGGITAAPGITLTKEGLGNVEFNVAPAGPGEGFQGAVVVNNGAVRVTSNVFANASAVTVNSGGQYQLASSSLPNWALGAGAVLTLNGSGKSGGANPEGALRYQNGVSSGSFDSPVALASTSAVFVNAALEPTPPNPVTYGKLTLSQEVSGPGGLVKNGSGILDLTFANTYGGEENGTHVVAGTLLANNTTGSATGTGAVLVDAGAKLGGSGFIAGTVTSVGGILSPGNSAGTLTLGGLILDALSTLDYELDSVAGPNDLIEVNGDLTLAGTLNVLPQGGFGVGVYRLFNYTGSFTDGPLTIAGLPTNLVGVIDTSIAGQVNLAVAAVPEPGTIVLGLIGGLGVVAARARSVRRRKND